VSCAAFFVFANLGASPKSSAETSANSSRACKRSCVAPGETMPSQVVFFSSMFLFLRCIIANLPLRRSTLRRLQISPCFSLTSKIDLTASARSFYIWFLSLRQGRPHAQRMLIPLMALRVLVVDDHESVRKGVCSILGSRHDIELCGEAADGGEAIEKTRSLSPDIIIMDITMPVMDGMTAAREIRKTWLNIAIIVLSMHDGKQLVDSARQFGLRGYVKKSEAASSLLQAVDSVIAGDPFFPPLAATF